MAEATVIIIDVSPSMNEGHDGETSLQKCIAAVNMIIQRKIFGDTKKKKDELALILFGTDGTSNTLHEQNDDDYKNITVAKEMGVMDLPLLQFVNEQITPGTSQADFIGAIVVALDHLHTKCMGRKMEQKIILFSNMCCEFEVDQLDMITGAMKGNDVNLIFVGPEVDDDDGDGQQEGGNDNHAEPSRNNQNGNQNRKPLSEQQKIGVNCIRHILDQVDGEGMSISEVLPLLSFFEKRRRKQVTSFRGPIEIGSTLKINTYAYVKISEEKPASWKKLSALAETAANRDTMAVDRQTTYHLNDEDQTEVDKENTAQAYRYGKTLVSMTSDEQKSMKLQTTKGCLVLGFTSQTNVDRHLFSRNGCHIFVPQPGDEHAAVAFSALCHALEEKNMVAIVRYVSRSNNDPKIGFLAPHIKSSYESLIFVALPYREDIRQFTFAPLTLDKKKEPSEEQLQAVDSLIDSMGLVTNVIIDDEEIKEELFKPRNILNPVTQRQCQCIQSRALNPDETYIPEIEEYIARSIKVSPEMAANCQATNSKIKELFPLVEVDQNKTKKTNIFATNGEKEEPDAKKTKQDDETNGFSFAALTRNQITEVGTVDPVNDFNVLIENANPERFLEVCEQMKNRILRLVIDSFLDQYYAKAFECLHEFKQECIKRKTSKLFNELLEDIKEATSGKRRNDFWELVITKRFIPISKKDDPASTYTAEQAERYFSNVEEIAATPTQGNIVNIEDEEDLLDLM